MSQEHQCPQCGKALVENAPQGLCPACLLKRALQTETSAGIGGASAAADTTPFAPPTPADLAPHFPELEILELLGYGGMGVVYKARQKRLNRLVALKILSPRIGKEPAFAERFAREAQALARLNHPHIVTVHDFGQSGELFYFVMEYVEGVNLRQLLNAGRIAPREALAIVPQICEALQFAHDSGVVHRDIKPENILLDKKGTVKIADFGLAKLMGAAEPASRSFHTPVSSLEHTLTQPGAVMGTPQYMAPEQTEHPDAVDHRADIYSLGVVFYQMLTGELPIGRFAVPSKKVVIDVRLDEVVLRALEKEPALRYQHASDVKTEIETIATTPQSSLLQQAEYDVPKQRENISQRPLLQKAEFDKWQWAYWVALIAVAIGGLLWLLDKTGVFHLTPAYAEASLVVAFLVSFVIVRIVLATLRRVQHASDLKAEVEATVATPRVSGESAAQGPAAPATGTRPKISMSWVSTPEHLRTFRGRFLYIYQGKGELCLDRETLSFRSGWQSVTIPLSSIRSLAQGMYPASAKPLPLHYIAVIFTEHGVSRTLLFTPVRTEVMSNKVAMEWLSAMQEAIEACTGRTLPITVQDACWGGRAKSFLLTMVTVTLGFAVIPMIREHRWPHLLSELLFGPITTICLFGFVYMVEIAKRRRDRQASDVKTKVKTIAGTPSILNSGMSAQPKTAWEAWKAWLWPPLVRQRDGRRFIHWPALALRTLRAMTAILVGGLALFEVVTVEGPASKAPLVAAIYVGVAALLVAYT